MSRYNDSSAVRIERFPVERVQYEERPGIEVLPRKKASSRVEPAAVPYGKYAVILACVFAVLLGIVASYMQLSTLNTQNARLRKEITALESEENALNAKKEQMYNLAYVEEYAQNRLGMVKAEKSQITYVQLDSGDRMLVAGMATAEERAEKSASLISRLSHSFSVVLEYFR
ncbi:MAG: septum formation initiator family protein [Clostridia bacterium]|nr:septum formation initiator family protein [Clostridia bacterium]